MTYQETLDYLYQQLPMFHRIGAAAYKADLKNTNALMELLDHPERDFRSIHIAGTNGKGSVSNMLAAILQLHGYKTGLFTSPHLKDFRERIRVDGKMIPKAFITSFVKKHKIAFDTIQPSFFEWTTALGFEYFSVSDIDVAVIETGMGGRLDSTNVIDPMVAVITNIGYDHMQFLGNTLAKISKEKAGIIKPGKPVVSGTEVKTALNVIQTVARKQNSKCYIASKLYECKPTDESNPMTGKLVVDIYRQKSIWLKSVAVGLGGKYQLKNIPIVLQTLELLTEMGIEPDRKIIRKGLEDVGSITGFTGRWKVLSKQPLTICDTAHNVDGIHEIMEQLLEIPCRQLHIVFGAVNDKDISNILKILPKNAKYYFCKPAIPRGYDALQLKKDAKAYGLKGNAYGSVTAAWDAAKDEAGIADIIFIGGSTFVVAEVV